jgi:hypothetical protein
MLKLFVKCFLINMLVFDSVRMGSESCGSFLCTLSCLEQRQSCGLWKVILKKPFCSRVDKKVSLQKQVVVKPNAILCQCIVGMSLITMFSDI